MTEQELDNLLSKSRPADPNSVPRFEDVDPLFFGDAAPAAESWVMRRLVPLAVAASLLAAFLFWHRSSVVAERDRALGAERVAEEAVYRATEMSRNVEALRRAGYLDPVVWHGWVDPKRQQSPFLISTTDELFLGGLVRPDIIERIEVVWDPDGQDARPETVYPRGTAPRGEGQVAFSARHQYKLDGRVVRPRFRAVPLAGSERSLASLGFAEERRGGEGAFRCSPLGLVIAAKESAAPAYEMAMLVLRFHGWVKVYDGKTIRDPKDLPAKPGVQQIDLGLNRAFKDDDFTHLLPGMGGVQGVGISSTGVTDASMPAVGQIRNLRWLYISNTAITDEGLRHLAGLKRLELLHAGTTKVGDKGLEAIRGLDGLTSLNLEATPVTDASVGVLEGFRNLKFLSLERTAVSDDAVRRLRESLPGCKIVKTATP